MMTARQAYEQLVPVLLFTWLCACDSTLAVERVGVSFHHDHFHVRGETVDSDAEVQAVEVDAAMGALVDRLLKRHSHPPSQGEMVEAGLRKMDINAAAKRL